jgi:hypothetical protein
MKKTLFLDFDGVLHGESMNARGLFEHIDLLCNFLRPYKDQIQIVISSSWREDYSLKELQAIFHTDLREMVVGVTPQIPGSYLPGGREKEIMLYCSENQITQWVALDDQTRFFSNNCPNLILTNCDTGLNHHDLNLLEMFILSAEKSHHDKLKIR